MKLNPEKGSYDQEWGWVGHDECDNPGPQELELIKHRYELEIHGGIVDEEACYSYDDWAVCSLGDDFYLLATSGCSCPSPSETWRVETGPTTVDGIRKHLLSGDYEGYTVPSRQQNEFLALLDSIEKK